LKPAGGQKAVPGVLDTTTFETACGCCQAKSRTSIPDTTTFETACGCWRAKSRTSVPDTAIFETRWWAV
jgi:hypothetical protein